MKPRRPNHAAPHLMEAALIQRLRQDARAALDRYNAGDAAEFPQWAIDAVMVCDIAENARR